MRIGVLGTGMVGRALASAFVGAGHEVMMGARTAGNERAVAWVAESGERSLQGSFADAAEFAEVVVNATAGDASLEALRAAGEERLAGKVLVDVANPIAHGPESPPVLAVCNTDSLGEQIQRAFPRTRVVKTLNTVNADVMVRPSLLAGGHNVFLSGDDAGAKDRVRALLHDLGWPDGDVVDLGGIATARATEMYLALWLRLFAVVGSPHYNVRLVREAR